MSTKKGARPADHLPLSPVMYHMLLTLIGQRERHGYGIKLEINERTNGRLDLDPGTIYGSLKKMLRMGLIDETHRREHDTKRRYYKLTKVGTHVVVAEFQRLEHMIKLGRTSGLPELRH